MKSVPSATNDARRNRATLIATVEELRHRLSFPQLAEDALGAIDPELTFLGRLKAGIERHPLMASALVAGASWLAVDALKAGGRSYGNGSRRRKMSFDTINSEKGDEP